MSLYNPDAALGPDGGNSGDIQGTKRSAQYIHIRGISNYQLAGHLFPVDSCAQFVVGNVSSGMSTPCFGEEHGGD